MRGPVPGSDGVVGICFERGMPRILAILSILKAGDTSLPLDPDDPTLRKETLIVDTKAKILLSTYLQRRDFDKAPTSKVIVSALIHSRIIYRISPIVDRIYW